MMAFSNRTKLIFVFGALVVVLVLAYVRIARSRNDSGLVGRKTDSQLTYLKSGGETADTSHGEPVKGDKGNGSNPRVTGYKSNSVTTYDASSLVKSDAKSAGETANSEGKHVNSDVKPVKVVKGNDNHEPNTTNANVAGKSNNISVEDMYHRLVYVSALSDNHFKEAKEMFKTVIGCLPKNKIIIFDLGLNEGHIKELSAYGNVEVRPFPFKNYSSVPHVKNLDVYAWKPIIAQIVSMEYDVIMYGDSSVRLLSCNLTAALQHLLQFPILSGAPTKPAAIQYTHDGMIKYFHFPASRKDMADIGGFQGGVWLMWANDMMKKKLIDPWVDCALHKECIAPSGAKLGPCGRAFPRDGHYVGCHRYDQSALNLILAREFGIEYFSKGTDISISSPIWVVRRM